MEHSIVLLRMYLYSLKFASDVWIGLWLWTITNVLPISITLELKIEICGNPSVMAYWFISLSLLSEEVWSLFTAFLTPLTFCSEFCVQKSKNFQFSLGYFLSVPKYLWASLLNIRLQPYTTFIWGICDVLEAAFMLGVSSRDGKTENAEDSRLWYAWFIQGQQMSGRWQSAHRNRFISNNGLWELYQFNISILNIFRFLLLQTCMCALRPPYCHAHCLNF